MTGLHPDIEPLIRNTEPLITKMIIIQSNRDHLIASCYSRRCYLLAFLSFLNVALGHKEVCESWKGAYSVLIFPLCGIS